MMIQINSWYVCNFLPYNILWPWMLLTNTATITITCCCTPRLCAPIHKLWTWDPKQYFTLLHWAALVASGWCSIQDLYIMLVLMAFNRTISEFIAQSDDFLSLVFCVPGPWRLLRPGQIWEGALDTRVVNIYKPSRSFIVLREGPC